MRLSEIARFTDDVDGLAHFYEKMLGKPPAMRGDGIAIFELDGGGHLLIHVSYEPQPNWPPGEDHVGFAVADVDATCEALQAAGLTLEHAPRDYEWGRSAYLRDPSGALLEIGNE